MMNIVTCLVRLSIYGIFPVLMSCKKEYLEIVPVVGVQEIQLPTQGTIKLLDFPTATVGFAGTGTGGEIYRTTNGGQSWNTIQLPSTNYSYIAFNDADTGNVLLSNGLYHTTNGGADWTYVGSARFVCRLSNGVFIADDSPGSPNILHLKRSTNNGLSYQTIGTNYEWLGQARACGDQLYVFGGGSGYIFDPITGTTALFGFAPAVYAGTRDLYFEGSCGVVVGDGGDIQEGCTGSFFHRVNPWSRWIMRAVDGYPGSARFAVGENSIMSNLDIGTEEKWNYVFNENGEGIEGSFHSIRVIEPGSFLVGSTNGVILNCTY